MAELTPEQQYQKEYDEAAAKLEAAANGTPPAATTAPAPEPEKAPEPEPAKAPEAAPVVDELAELRKKVEAAEKALKDTQAWGTKNAQELATIKREREQAQRDAAKPAILDANPELVDAIKYVTSDPAPQHQAEDQQQAWMRAIDTAHPGIFAADADPELIDALVAKRNAAGAAWDDPLVAIRDITAEKLSHAERQIGKRFAIESAKIAEKSAMSVPSPGASSGVTAPVDVQLAEVQRIQNMSQADFAKEVAKVRGYS